MTVTNSLSSVLASGKKSASASPRRDGPLFMAHMIAGYPTLGDSEKVAKALAEGGADIIELQIPFSDPMADGPTIAVACEEALKRGLTIADSLTLLSKVAKMAKPVAVMSYLNPVYRFGVLEFAKTIREAGASALIVPDCPFDTEEGRALIAACREAGLYFVPVVSPGVPAERLQTLAKDSDGFVYCTTRQGITGATGSFADDLKDFVKLLKSTFNLPIAVGFGVKSKSDVEQLAQTADIVIAGSVFVDAIKSAPSDPASAVEKTLRGLTS